MELAAGGLGTLGRAQRNNLEQKVRGGKRLNPEHPRLKELREQLDALAGEHGGQHKLAQAAEHVDERFPDVDAQDLYDVLYPVLSGGAVHGNLDAVRKHLVPLGDGKARLTGHADPTYGPEGVLTATGMALRKLVHVLDLLEEEAGSERSAA